MKINKPDVSQTPALRDLWKQAFGDADEFLNDFWRTAFSFERCRCVTINNELVAALYWFDCEFDCKKIAYIYAVATDNAHQGKGYCHKLMEDTHRHLSSIGYAGALLVPSSEKLFKFYEGIGYKTACFYSEISSVASTEKVNVRKIDKVEYSKLRRQMLPEGGIIQENENLDFLETQAVFYSGTDFLLVAEEEHDSICGIEFLGDKSKIPEILNSLGYTKGKFKTVGNDIPFAMYYPLDNKLALPRYFGFAFN